MHDHESSAALQSHVLNKYIIFGVLASCIAEFFH